MGWLATVRTEERDSEVIAQIAGEIDESNALDIREQLLAAATEVPEGVGRLLVDLSRLQFIDSAGIARLFEVSAMLQPTGIQIVAVVPPDGVVRRTLELTRFDRTVPLFASVSQAITASDPAPPPAPDE